MSQIKRILFNNIVKSCFKGKALIVLGARQVGKTTLLREVQEHFDVTSIWLNADEADVLSALTNADTSTALLELFGKKTKLVIIDEAHQIPKIGLKLKLLHDTKPDLQVIVTGSSSLELQDNLNEPLTGRKKEFIMYPVSFSELVEERGLLEEQRSLETRLIYGSYPDVINNPGEEREILTELVSSYLYKDILQLGGIRKPAMLEKLLQALAFQVGSEVSFHELAQLIGNVDPKTIENYLDLLEKAFVIYKLPALSRNLRNELKKGKKYYFYDNGVRNVIISNYNPIQLRDDIGALWENYLLVERMKFLEYNRLYANQYFWRTHDQAEIDYIEETGGIIHAVEFKWKKRKVRFPQSFREGYPSHKLHNFHKDNYVDFLQKEL